MKCLLDSDTLIRAKNDFYRFESAPGFWECLEDAHRRGTVYSVAAVRKELQGEDRLALWAKKMGSKFFLAPDAAVQIKLKELTKWVENHKVYSDAAKQTFLSKADYVLVAHAAAHGFYVVTFEKHENSVHKIKIPDACDALSVKSGTLFSVTGALGLNLVQHSDKPRASELKQSKLF